MSIPLMIVDDEEGIRNSLKEYFEMEGYDVDTAKDGEEAIKMTKQKKYSIVLMDINMPLLDGIESMQAIKEIDFSIQVIMMTAYSTFEKTMKSLELGATDYILKPFGELDELLRLVEISEERLSRWRRNMAESIVKQRKSMQHR
ncbi:MAG: response regulator [Nitrospinota bacterium]